MPRNDRVEDSNVIVFPFRRKRTGLSAAQRAWLVRGIDQPGGKLPLFDEEGQHYPARTIRSCIDRGWAEPWFRNPLKPDWLVCKLTQAGRDIALASESSRRHGAEDRDS